MGYPQLLQETADVSVDAFTYLLLWQCFFSLSTRPCYLASSFTEYIRVVRRYGDQFYHMTQSLLPVAIGLHLAFGCWLLAKVDKAESVSLVDRVTVRVPPCHPVPPDGISHLVVVSLIKCRLVTIIRMRCGLGRHRTSCLHS